MTTALLSIKEIVNILDKREAYFKQIFEIAKHQYSLLEKGSMTEIEKFQAERQTIVENIQKIDGDLKEFFQKWESVKRKIDKQTTDKIDNKINQSKDFARETLKFDDKMTDIISKAMNEIKKHIQTQRQTTKAIKSYTTAKYHFPKRA